MRTCLILLLAAGLALVACDDSGAPLTSPPAVGTLVVSTASGGNDRDRDGYLLTVDGGDSLFLDPTGISQIDLPAGQHTLRLLGMAEHCSVSPGTPLDVDVPSQDTTAVMFEVTCSVSGVRVTNTTTGLDLDPDGYLIQVDGDTPGILSLERQRQLIRFDPGSRTITLTAALAPNCTIEGPGSRTVTIVDAESAQSSSRSSAPRRRGVIGVTVEASWSQSGRATYQALRGRNGIPSSAWVRRRYLPGAAAGDHIVSRGCHPTTVPVGTKLQAGHRDRRGPHSGYSRAWAFRSRATQQFGRIRITAPTTGHSTSRSPLRSHRVHQQGVHLSLGADPATKAGAERHLDRQVRHHRGQRAS